MQVAFILSMPGVNSWNGRWSGEKNIYAVVKTFSSKKAIEKVSKLIQEKSFDYSFGDGWRAQVDLKKVERNEAAKLRKISRGFCGYDWMINEILEVGRIRTLQERRG